MNGLACQGTVVRVNDDIAAYTFGYWLTPQTWCILLEVADRSIPGLAQWVFRETCRTAMAQGATSINAMDDAGSSGTTCGQVGLPTIRGSGHLGDHKDDRMTQPEERTASTASPI